MAVPRHRPRPEDVVVWLELLYTPAVVHAKGDIGVKVEAIEVRLAWGCRCDPGSLGIATEAQNAATGAGAKCAAALHRCADDSGQGGGGVFERIDRSVIRVIADEPMAAK
jgi:hypothetical protein